MYAPYAALTLGAKIIEKHYVDKHDRKGPDISCSMDAMQLKELIKASKIIPSTLPGKKEPIQEELITMNFAFSSVVSRRFINKGSKFNENNICLKRPGNGDFLSKDFRKILGKIAKKDIKENIQIKKEYLK